MSTKDKKPLYFDPDSTVVEALREEISIFENNHQGGQKSSRQDNHSSSTTAQLRPSNHPKNSKKQAKKMSKAAKAAKAAPMALAVPKKSPRASAMSPVPVSTKREPESEYTLQKRIRPLPVAADDQIAFINGFSSRTSMRRLPYEMAQINHFRHSFGSSEEIEEHCDELEARNNFDKYGRSQMEGYDGGSTGYDDLTSRYYGGYNSGYPGGLEPDDDGICCQTVGSSSFVRVYHLVLLCLCCPIGAVLLVLAYLEDKESKDEYR